MKKLLALLLTTSLISSIYAQDQIQVNKYKFSSLDNTVEVTMDQYLDRTLKVGVEYISDIKLTNTDDNCSVELKPQVICSEHSINFCGYTINRQDYTIEGLIGASYAPLFQTAIKLNGTLTRNGCTINTFDYVYLYPKNGELPSYK